jgi:undecaprenyl-diphosphatase
MPEWIQNVDKQFIEVIRDHHDKWLTYNLNNVTALGSTTVLALVAVVTLGGLVLMAQCKKAFLFAVLVIGAYYATNGIKNVVARHRPAGAKSHSASFPSSHSSLSMAVFGMVALSVRKRGIEGRRRLVFWYALLCALILAGLVGISRVYLGYHYPSDVVAGWLLGLIFMIVYFLADKLTESRG